MLKSVNQTIRQEIFIEIVIGTLIYSVVFGFFSDYTNLIYTSSYSITFLAALLMQLLVYPTFKLKILVARWFRKKNTKARKIGLAISIWAILFFSKFVFLEVLNFVLGEYIEIGFIGVIAVIIFATILANLTQMIYLKLGSITK